MNRRTRLTLAKGTHSQVNTVDWGGKLQNKALYTEWVQKQTPMQGTMFAIQRQVLNPRLWPLKLIHTLFHPSSFTIILIFFSSLVFSLFSPHHISNTMMFLIFAIRVFHSCNYSAQIILCSRLLSKNLKIEIYKIIILPVVLYGCETWSRTLREECRLRVFENRILKWIFGPKRYENREWRRLHNEELHSLYRSL